MALASDPPRASTSLLICAHWRCFFGLLAFFVWRLASFGSHGTLLILLFVAWLTARGLIESTRTTLVIVIVNIEEPVDRIGVLWERRDEPVPQDRDHMPLFPFLPNGGFFAPFFFFISGMGFSKGADLSDGLNAMCAYTLPVLVPVREEAGGGTAGRAGGTGTRGAG